MAVFCETETLQQYSRFSFRVDLLRQQQLLPLYNNTNNTDQMRQELDNADNLEIFRPPEPPKYEIEFKEKAVPVQLNISRVSEELVSKQQEEVENVLMKERLKTSANIRAKEVDILW